ncbi:hypothetical protein N7520_011565 [Penicillium odoratum]|uniref:uncharacterized protein n=1 Tax=Penicillium odoratum TaxID=1167516 RepID=UPI002546C774|nr:uncharacterized protein N7520_011565 [Penicillium odoratum]KAJ5746383.1 hypothetical protein N7520_011565 [Penicillium odoratum]
MAQESEIIEPDSSASDSAYSDTYHSYHEGEYVLPNDEQEQDRLDLVGTHCICDSNLPLHILTIEQSHHIYLMLLKGELYSAPIRNPKRVLDLGTGTGIWAIDFAEVPLNCRFQIDDFEEPWSYSHPFDYIHGRELEGAIRNHDKLFKQAFDNLTPNGWFEMASMEVNTHSDDGTHLKATCMVESVKNLHAASKSFGKDMDSVSTWKERFENTGFVNVREDVYKLPQSPWPRDPKMKELGRYHQLNMLEAMPPYCVALFTRVLGWNRVEVEGLLAGVRFELKDLSCHLYSKVHIVYGQRPV